MHTITLGDSSYRVNTIYCIGRSYVEHIHELDHDVPDEPLVFLKPNSSIITGNIITLPGYSDNIHHEIELVLLIGDNKQIIAVTVGLDLTARDIQSICKDKGLPWLKAKGFKNACWLGDFLPFEEKAYNLSLSINDEIRQDDSTKKMMYSFHDLINHLDTLYGLQAGDLIMTGTPKGVGKLMRGDKLSIKLDETAYHVDIK